MNDNYKLGYENGRCDILRELKVEITKQSEPLLQKVLKEGTVTKYNSGQLDAINEISKWCINKVEKMEEAND
ncbi:hypothetical protein PS421_08245 [Pediococcus pentosaceus]|uniref:hypothetical protein n=1 Tax=Pediococcus pentosaceus TaxID=1255 RepID=UPI002F260DDF